MMNGIAMGRWTGPSLVCLTCFKWKWFPFRTGLVGCAWLLVVACAAQAWSQPADSVRYVKRDKIKVYCGPSSKLYPTSQLRQGTAVEIFHRNKDGWCAIRPPEGSFCWLAAENAYLLSGGELAEVVGNKVPAWIGSQLEAPSQFRWQIELQPTQQVRVLGEAKQKIDEDTERLWYKISPPQGEFRWIHEDGLSLQPPIADPTYPPLQTAPPAGLVKREPALPVGNETPVGSETSVDFEAKEQLREKNADRKNPKSQPKLASHVQPTQMIDGSVKPAQFVEETLPAPMSAASRVQGTTGTQGVVLNDGEYIVGDEVVVSDEVVGTTTSPTRDSVQPMYADDDVIDESGGVIYEDGEIIEEDSSEFSAIHLSHADDPRFEQWNALHAPHGRILVRPLNGLLGLIGFGLEEAEVVDTTCDECVEGHGVGSSHNLAAGRLDHLPSPRRRNKRTLESYFPIGQNQQPVPARTDDMELGRDSDRGVRSLLTNRSELPPNHWADAGSRGSDTMDSSPLQLSSPDLREAFMELTRIVSRPTEQWDLREVHQFAQERIDRGQSAMERGEARLLTERIEQFEKLRQKSLIAAGGSSLSGFSNAAVSPAASWQPAAVGTANTNGLPFDNGFASSRYGQGWSDGESAVTLATAEQSDASGWLSPVHTSRPGQPEYALTDADGKVLAYVTAAPGLNLRRYTKQAVAIYGTKGYLPELAAKQILAERIVRIR